MKKALAGIGAAAVLAGGAFALQPSEKPLTAYELWSVHRNDAGQILDVRVRFYEVEERIVTVPISSATTAVKHITRKVYTKRLKADELPHLTAHATLVEKSGNEAKEFTTKDFGVIYTDEELYAYLDGVLAQDSARRAVFDERI